jgi:hypothetical protein
MSVFSDWLDSRGITPEEAARRTGIGVALIDILCSGGVTLPTLSCHIGHYLDAPTEVIRTTGKPMDERNWGANEWIVKKAHLNFEADWADRYDEARRRSVWPVSMRAVVTIPMRRNAELEEWFFRTHKSSPDERPDEQLGRRRGQHIRQTQYTTK